MKNAIGFFFLSFYGVSSFAAMEFIPQNRSITTCPTIDAATKIISANPDADKAKREYEAYADVATKLSDMNMKNVSDGLYMFLIANKGKVFWSPAVPNLNTLKEPWIVTHRSLAAFALQEGLSAFVAAGEFRIMTVDGQRIVQQVNNRSNTYRGDKNSLLLAFNFLSYYGLEMAAKTVLVDYSDPVMVGKDHATMLTIATNDWKYRKDPDVPRVQSIMEGLMKRYPHKIMRRAADKEAIEKHLEELKVDVAATGPDRDLLDHLIFILLPINNDSPATILDVIKTNNHTVTQVSNFLKKYNFITEP